MRIRRILYGWQIPSGQFVLSRHPPDLPQVPAEVFASIGAAESAAVERKAEIVWSGPALYEKQRLTQA